MDLGVSVGTIGHRGGKKSDSTAIDQDLLVFLLMFQGSSVALYLSATAPRAETSSADSKARGEGKGVADGRDRELGPARMLGRDSGCGMEGEGKGGVEEGRDGWICRSDHSMSIR